jgi:predicted negative regulator of RcsB-dependent stress response
MTHIKYEDLKLALEALESTRIIEFSVEDIVSWKKAITAFKQALATQPAPVQEPVALADEVIGCFDAAEIEGLTAALANTTDEHLKDLVERRLMYALFAAQEAKEKQK